MPIKINNLENKTKNILQKSNISKFINSTSQTDLLKILNPQDDTEKNFSLFLINMLIDIEKRTINNIPLLPLIPSDSDRNTITKSSSKIRELNDEKLKILLNYENSLQVMSDVFESITSEGVFINEFIQYLYNTYDEDILNKISKDIRIIHSKNPYNINILNKTTTTDIPFYIKKEKLTNKNNTFTYKEKYGLTSQQQQQQNINNELMNLEEIADPQDVSNPPKISFINKVDGSKNINPSKNETSFAYILIDNPVLRAGTRNTLELSTFFNTLSTVELSKCYPYLNVTLILPKIFRNSTGNIFESASLTNFFRGTSDDSDKTTGLYKNISKNKIELSIAAPATAAAPAASPSTSDLMNSSNMSIFTMPQSVVNFNEKKTGNYYDNDGKNDNTKRLNAVLDIARPFMTIKNFSVDVAPTQGLLSFKTGKLSLVLHDKSRLPEIAPFIKADLFGTSGSEIAIEYGWDSIDRDNPNNFLAQFLAKNRVLEKYIITNSSFNMSNNGEVNIDLSIALKGPLDLRTVKLAADPFSTIEKNALETIYAQIINKINDDDDDSKKIKLLFETLYKLFHSLDNNSYNEFKKNKINLQNTQLSYEDKLLKTYINKQDKTKIIIDHIIYFLDSEGNTKNINYYTIYDETSDNEGNDTITPLFAKFLEECDKIHSEIVRNNEKVEEITKKIIRGLGIVDPFYNKDLVYDYYRVGNSKIKTDKPKYIQVGFLPDDPGKSASNDNATDYVTFGALLSSIVGQHFCNSKKYDEIQIISYTANRNAGLMAYRNLSSLMIKRSELNEYLKDLFKGGREFSIEGLLSQILNEFVTTRTNICYGISSKYKKDVKTGVVTPIISDVAAQNKTVNETLHTIYTQIINDRIEKINPKGDILKEITGDEKDTSIVFPFEIPKIKLMFDTLTNKDDALERTILRISVYDELDNPFSAVSEILFENTDNNKIFKTVGYLNRIKLEKGETKFIEHGNAIFKKLLEKNYIKEDPANSGLYIVDKSFGLMPFKSEFKKIMPSMTYGTENSAILDASVTTINEAKLNTVFLTRENSQTNQTTQVVSFSKDLPLRVLPSQANLTIFGCPFVNFAQYYFLDFLTGTTIDNIYAVTGIKHDISPGKFTTSLTMSYGDIYGKYENALSTLDKVKKKVSDEKSEEDKENCEKCYLNFINKITKGEAQNYSDYFAISIKTIKKEMDKFLKTKNAIDITQLNIKNIYEFQDELKKQIQNYNNNNSKKITVSTAVGKAQILKNVLNTAINNLKIEDTILFDKKTQDKISIYLITDKRPKFFSKSINDIKNKFKELKNNKENFKKFLDSPNGTEIIKHYFLGLAYEFTSIPNPYDKSFRSVYYNSGGSRKALAQKQAKNGDHNINDKDFVKLNSKFSIRKNKYNNIYKSIKKFFLCIVDCSTEKTKESVAPATSAQPPVSAPAQPASVVAPAATTVPVAEPTPAPALPAAASKPTVPVQQNIKNDIEISNDNIPANAEIMSINKTLLLDLKNIDKNQTFIKTFYDIKKDDSGTTTLKILFKSLKDENINKIFNQDDSERIVNNRIISKRTTQKSILSLFSYSLLKIKSFKHRNYDINELLKQVIIFFKEYSKTNIQIKILKNIKEEKQYQKYNFRLILNILETFENFNIKDINDDRILIKLIGSDTNDNFQKLINEHNKKYNKLIEIENLIYDFYNKLLSFIESQEFIDLYDIVKEFKYKHDISILLSISYDFYYMLKFFVLMRNDYYFNKRIIQDYNNQYNNQENIIIINSFDSFDINEYLMKLEFEDLKKPTPEIDNIIDDFQTKFKELKTEFKKDDSFINGNPEQIKSIENKNLTEEYIKKYEQLFNKEINQKYFNNELNPLVFINIGYTTIVINDNDNLFDLVTKKEIEIDLNIKYFIDEKINNIKYYKKHCKLNEDKNKIKLELVFSIKNNDYLSNILIISKDIIDLQTLFKSIIKNVFIDDLIIQDDKDSFITKKVKELEGQYDIKLKKIESFSDFNFYINNNVIVKNPIKITKGKTSFTKKEIQQYYLDKNNKLKTAYEKLKKGETNITLKMNDIQFLNIIFNNYNKRISVLYDIKNDDLVFTKLGETKKFYFDDPRFLANMLKDKEFSDRFNYFYY